ncbi:MAG TPA: carboxypeptidase-like regulatory domain-containing protein, partial [Terriglobia bacterium]|nr:carboxypeptidase-like regulatory domain-containing protein [Terriglobia bacterium]
MSMFTDSADSLGARRTRAMAVVILALGLALLASESRSQGAGSLGGRVVDQTTGKPIQGASVSISRYRKPGDPSPPEAGALQAIQAIGNRGGGGDIPAGLLSINKGLIATQPTAADGTFRFTGLTAGDYTLAVTADRYLPQEYGQRVPGGRARVLTVQANENVGGADFQLTRLGIIAGTVVDATGAPMARVRIQVYVKGRSTSESPNGNWARIGNSVTDSQGRYRLDNLRPGDYYVSVFPQSTSAAPYVPLFHPGASDIESATPIVVPAAGELNGIDFRVSATKPAEITGKVTLPGAASLPPIGVALVRFDIQGDSTSRVTVTAEP